MFTFMQTLAYFAISRHLDCVKFTQSTSQSSLNNNNTVGSQPNKGTLDLFTTITRTTVNSVTVDGKLTSLVYTRCLTHVTTVAVTKGHVTLPERAAFTLPSHYQNKLAHRNESNTPCERARRQDYNIEMVIMETGCEEVNCIDLCPSFIRL